MILNIDNYEVLKFYGYTSIIRQDERIYDVSQISTNKAEKRRYERLSSFYDRVINKAKSKLNNSDQLYYTATLSYNKCVFKLKHIKSGNIIYIGKYDFEISIGLNVHQRFGYSYDFITNKQTYKNDEL